MLLDGAVAGALATIDLATVGGLLSGKEAGLLGFLRVAVTDLGLHGFKGSLAETWLKILHIGKPIRDPHLRFPVKNSSEAPQRLPEAPRATLKPLGAQSSPQG